jgi:hypothetical protein
MRSRTSKKSRLKDPNVYPPGWNYKRAKAVAKYYDDRKDVDFIKDVVLLDPESLPVWVEVPQKLLPQVRKLIARYKKSA